MDLKQRANTFAQSHERGELELRTDALERSVYWQIIYFHYKTTKTKYLYTLNAKRYTNAAS